MATRARILSMKLDETRNEFSSPTPFVAPLLSLCHFFWSPNQISNIFRALKAWSMETCAF